MVVKKNPKPERPIAKFQCRSCKYTAYHMSAREVGEIAHNACPKCGGNMGVISSGEIPKSLAKVEAAVSKNFNVIDFDISDDHMQFEVETDDTKNSFANVYHELSRHGYLAALRKRGSDLMLLVMKFPRIKKDNIWINVGLFSATIATTFLAGYFWLTENNVFEAALFAGALLVILSSHEIGHKIAAWRNGVAATLPYYIPAPTFIGTFGAFIKVKSPIPTKEALVEMGATGPLLGFLFALPITVAGLMLSKPTGGEIYLPMPISFALLGFAKFGTINYTLNLHPLAFAGLIGMFVTWLNLIPAGQLDGGHVARGMLNANRHYQLTKWTGIGLIALGLFWLPLFMWGILILLLFRSPHMGALDDLSPLSRRQKLLAAAAFTVFILCLPIPF
jgi:membrane-associated protease RseP (regulator of RpoE activity)